MTSARAGGAACTATATRTWRPAEVIRFCDEALALSPDFKLARYLRFRALRQLAQAGSVDNDYLLRDLARAAHPLPGRRVAVPAARLDAAWSAACTTSASPPTSTPTGAIRTTRHNLQGMGEARWLAGDLGLRRASYLLAALTEGPDFTRAAENLAAVYLRSLEATGSPARTTRTRTTTSDDDERRRRRGRDDDRDDDDEDRRRDGGRGRTHEDEDEARTTTTTTATAPAWPPARLRNHLACTAPAELLRRARHFSRVALAAQPGQPVQPRGGRRAGPAGRRALAAAADVVPPRPRDRSGPAPRPPLADRGRSRSSATSGRPSASSSSWSAARPSSAESHLVLARVPPPRCDRDEEAAAALGAAVDRVTRDRERLVEPLYSVARGPRRPARRPPPSCATWPSATWATTTSCAEVVTTLDNEGQRGHALALARHLAERAPGDPVRDLAARPPARRQRRPPRRGARPVPSASSSWRRTSRSPASGSPGSCSTSDPAAALAVIEPVLATRRTATSTTSSPPASRRSATSAAADRALARALQAAPSPDLGLAMLINRHCMRRPLRRAPTSWPARSISTALDGRRQRRARVRRVGLADRLPAVRPRPGGAAAGARAVRRRGPGAPRLRGLLLLPPGRPRAGRRAPPTCGRRTRTTRPTAPSGTSSPSACAPSTPATPASSTPWPRSWPPHASAWAELSYSYERLERYARRRRRRGARLRARPAGQRRLHRLDRGARAPEPDRQGDRLRRGVRRRPPLRAPGPGAARHHPGQDRAGRGGARPTRRARWRRRPTATCRSRAAPWRCSCRATTDGALEYARRSSGNEPPRRPTATGSSDDELLIAALTGDVAAVDRGPGRAREERAGRLPALPRAPGRGGRRPRRPGLKAPSARACLTHARLVYGLLVYRRMEITRKQAATRRSRPANTRCSPASSASCSRPSNRR